MPIPDSAAPIPRQSARRAVYDHLKGWIESGHFKPGEVVRDREIAEQLGVSRTPVREALQMLEQSGVVEMLPGHQTRVTEATAGDVTLVYGPLASLQAFAAEVATPRASARDIAELKRCNAALYEAIQGSDAVAARAADAAFHQVFLRLADNRYLTAAIDPLQMHVHRLETAYFRRAQPSHESYEEHEAIIEAVAAGASERARELVRANFQRYLDPTTAGDDAELAPAG